MKRAIHALALAMLLAPSLAASGRESRVRIESPSARAPVDIVLTEVDPSKRPGRVTSAGIDGGEITVEAAAPRPRLRGGALRTDPMIDLLATQMLRQSSPSAPTVMVLPNSEPTAPRYGAFPYAWTTGDADSYGCCYAQQFASWDSGGGRHTQHRDRAPRAAPAPQPASRGSFTARALMPRR